MKLGGSIGRRRPGRRARAKRRARRKGRRPRASRSGDVFGRALRVLLLAVFAFGTGYAIAARVVFPASEPPPELLEVPDLAGLDQREAVARAEAAGLAPGAVDSMFHPVAPAGSVLGQSPLPGQLAVPGTAVELAVSLGAEWRAVPDVVGEPGRRARILLGANGFSVAVDTVESDEPRGEVVAVEPETGTGVHLPFEVRLAVSLGPPVVEMPLLLGLDREEATALLDSLGLFVVEVEREASARGGPVAVIGQDPPPARTVEVGSGATLTVGDRALLPTDLPARDTAGAGNNPRRREQERKQDTIGTARPESAGSGRRRT